MRVVWIVDPLHSLNVKKDSSIAMMREAATRGHAVYVCEVGDLFLREGKARARVVPLTIRKGSAWFSAAEPIETGLEAFDAVLMRKDPPFDMEYVYATYLLELAVQQGAKVFNHPRAIRDHNEKLAIGRFPAFTAPTLVTRQMSRIQAFISEQQDVILKPLDGMGGSAIFRVQAQEPNRNVIIETLTAQGTRTIMAQRYLPAIIYGDKRVLLIDGEPIPYALARIPQHGDNRGNLAAGGKGVAQPLSAHDYEIARTVGAYVRTQGLLLVGLDIIGEHLTEINVTSPTCFVEITQQTGFNVAGCFLDALAHYTTVVC